MKTHYWIAILFITSVFTSCSESDDPIETNFVSAELNNIPWAGQPEINIDGDSLVFLGIGNEQVVVFKIKFEGEGSYQLSTGQALFYTTVGQDALTSQFILNSDQTSQVIINQYDADSGTISGQFELTLAQEWSNPKVDTNTLWFSDGKFSGIINAVTN